METAPSTATNTKVAEVGGQQIADRSSGAAQLAANIERRIRRQTSSRIRDLTVEVCAGSIILRGRCLTFYTKQLAGHAAMGVLEGETLSNQIEVALP